MSNADTLEPQQYEAVLRYMEATNVEDFDSAMTTMKQHQFNFHVCYWLTQSAMNRRYGDTGGAPNMMGEPVPRD